MDAPIQLVQKLMNLALDKGATSEEARTAAYTAIRIIHTHKLLESEPTPQARPNPGNFEPDPEDTFNEDEGGEDDYLEAHVLRHKVNSTVQHLLSHLRRKAKRGDYPYIRLDYLVEQAIANNDIPERDRRRYWWRLREALRAKVSEGVLVAKRARNGGYRLA